MSLSRQSTGTVLGLGGQSVEIWELLTSFLLALSGELFQFPKTTSKNNILSCFGRRCAVCDSLYLAAIQLAGASTSRNELWKDLVQDLRLRRVKSKMVQ
jgi:hypothetical protein